MIAAPSILCIATIVAAVTGPITDITGATTAFLAGLNDTQRAAAVYPFDAEERWNWHFVPRDRSGVSFGDLDESQYPLALAVLSAALSERGYKTVETIRDLEQVLREIEGPQATHRDPLKFYFTVFGAPAQNGTWALRYEGHHLSLHWTIVDGKAIATTPQFIGSNPGDVRSGPMKGTRALGDLEDLGRAFVHSLNDEQRAVAVVDATAPRDILTGNDLEAARQEDVGIGYTDLSSEQRQALVGLIEAYAQYQRPEIAAQRLSRIREAGLEDMKFVWLGGLEKGAGHYYRVQGKTFIIEYDNTQNDANHVHTVWRDFNGDFGRDLLKEHHAQHPH